jgi:NAD(P)-dependent dehydrogenase (short-subunit alcohol dehydrogenase family)
MAKTGVQLVLPARNADRAAAMETSLRALVPDVALDVRIADLSVMDEVRRFGDAVAADHPVIDLLVNNAGVHAFGQRVTPDGFPIMIATNYLSPWLLTSRLLPALQRSAAARVVTVASEASRRHGTLRLPADLTDVAPFTSRGSSVQYGKSKLLAIMFALELARRTEGTEVASICLDPGFNTTGLGRELRGAAAIERVLRALRIGDPNRGAGLILRAATGGDFGDRSGEYWTVRGPRRIAPAAPADDAAARRELWDETEALLHRR